MFYRLPNITQIKRTNCAISLSVSEKSIFDGQLQYSEADYTENSTVSPSIRHEQ